MTAPSQPFDVTSFFELAGAQVEAANLRGVDIAVTAGAGSGKTRTLVARYLGLLADGLETRQVAAITFTEKAAREMRNRVRTYLAELRRGAETGPQEQFWARLEAQMDAAHIGTIHGLCSEILRANPVEAGLDPQFAVLDENQALALQVKAVEAALQHLLSQPVAIPLIETFKIDTLRSLASFSLQHRLDLAEWLEQPDGEDRILAGPLSAFLDNPRAISAMDDVRNLQRSPNFGMEYSEKALSQVAGLLKDWDTARQQFQSAQFISTATTLHHLRFTGLSFSIVRKESQLKSALTELRILFDSSLGGWLKDPPDPQLETAVAVAVPLVRQLFRMIQQEYLQLKEGRQVVDFDDLEGGAVHLLQNGSVRQKWQTEIQAVLVDEFQDTNQRQRQIIEAITSDQPGKLFVVGDSRQSIYRFRGADVTVFQRLQKDIQQQGGRLLLLEKTYRAHPALTGLLSALLKPIMSPIATGQPVDQLSDGQQAALTPEYWVPYSALQPERPAADPSNQPPYLEFIVGKGENADEGRQAAAQALAWRLLELSDAGQIQDWSEVALLFRSTTNFPDYEDALENAGIPYVTVSGKGFFDRPEIRDVLNILRALADPWDDLAVAGMLRSPAFGLSDASLFHLRWPAGSENQVDRKPRPLYSILLSSTSTNGDAFSAIKLPEHNGLNLSAFDLAITRRAARFLQDFSTEVDRIPVAELLKKIVDKLHLRAILASSRTRLWRNLDKLLVDAQASGIVQVSVFFEFLQTLRDVGAREGEAAVDAQGAVQLMSIHKAKGLEFPIVILADASNQGANRKSSIIHLPGLGLGIRPDRPEGMPLAVSLLQELDRQQSLAENRRLLYVALTRAREKILINGHIAKKQVGWLAELAQIAGLSLDLADGTASLTQELTLPDGLAISGKITGTLPLGFAFPGGTQAVNLSLSGSIQHDPHLGSGQPLEQSLVEPALEEEDIPTE